MSNAGKRKEDLPLSAPNQDGNVWPHQRCPAFVPRCAGALNECWFCVHADFHLDQTRALEVGVCCWPKKQGMERGKTI